MGEQTQNRLLMFLTTLAMLYTSQCVQYLDWLGIHTFTKLLIWSALLYFPYHLLSNKTDNVTHHIIKFWALAFGTEIITNLLLTSTGTKIIFAPTLITLILLWRNKRWNTRLENY